ncbi:PhzF family phenazine biosynthesis protein [Peptoniphilus indolicus]|uniref:Uncharacterized isomerase yddE n=2 Tax=Peptoniphilus indolicus TaxID=33030 RepID=A0A379DCD2_9FIRM|nr:PhzF family phenazine biosynthesis protein [Peptoniphilus indolicus]EGY80563.1 putative phenazine biosynthesis protein [Peptoniphilus indolicus ATCC 29427]SUB75604.1 Uncharacterized isomerase yddE [Peptoniphilus indolicus]
MRYLNMYLVNAFTDRTFDGNPTGVVVGSNSLNDEEMQKIARDLRMSETVFIDRLDVGVYKTRFFTPNEEISLCGHATIATFYALCKHNYILPIEDGIKKVVQHTKSGKVYVDLEYKDEEIQNVYILLDGVINKRISSDEEIINALGITKDKLGIGDKFYAPAKVKTGLQDIVVPVKDIETLYSIEPSFEEVLKISEKDEAISVEVFTVVNGSQIVQRTFSSSIGIDEEAGSATSTGATLLYLNKNTDLNFTNIKSTQGACLGRESKLSAEMIGEDRVRVGGKAFVFMEGVLHI